MLDIGSPLPPVELLDPAGAPAPVTARADRPTLLVFVKGDCDTTAMALPVYAQYRRYEPRVGFVAVSQDDPEVTADWLGALGLEVPVTFDPPPHRASAAFDLSGVPALYLTVAGEISWMGAGWYRPAAEELNERLAELAGAAPVPLAGVAALPLFRPG